jgi:GDSL-like lipase/acylhydrolase family protein
VLELAKPLRVARSEHTRRRARRLVARGGLLLASAGLSVLVAELVVRSRPGLFETGYRPSADPKLVYELAPNLRLPGLRIATSDQGLNDRAFAPTKPQGVFRIAVVGDSTSFGWKVGGEKSLAKVLERELNQPAPGRFEVMNFSVPGYNTAQELEVIRARVLPFHPDLVVLVFTGNDVNLCNYIQPEPTLLGALVHRSYLLNLLLRKLEVALGGSGPAPGFPPWWVRFKREALGAAYPIQRIYPQPGLEETTYQEDHDPPRDPAQVPQRYHYMLGYPNYRVHLAEIRDLLARESIPLVSTGLLTNEALEIQRELGLRNVVTGLWPSELARDFGTGEPLVIPEDGHYTALGHELAARRILHVLRERGLVEPPGG